MYKYYLIFLGYIIIGLLAYRFFTYPYYLNSGSFKTLYKSGDIADEIVYPIQCYEEITNNLNFPLGVVDKAIVCSGFFSIDNKINKENIPTILKILNDTSSYIWGEVGTFIPGKKIVFYDKENKPIGITEIDVGGQFTYSYPYLKKMKWGTLTFDANKELLNLLP